MKSALALFLFNRFEHSYQTIKSIGSSGFDNIYVFVDGPKTGTDVHAQERIISEAIPCLGKKLKHLVKREKNIGLAKSIRSGVDFVFADGSDAVVVLEDDCVLLPGAHNFFEGGLFKFQDQARIRSLCGFLIEPKPLIKEINTDLLILQRFNTWGWGTWRDRWEGHERSFVRNLRELRKLNMPIEHISQDLARYAASEKYLNDEVDIWSLNWILSHYITRSYCIYPAASVVNNIGFDGSGVNCDEVKSFSQAARPNHNVELELGMPNYYPENEAIIEKFMWENSQKIYPKI